MSIFGQNIQDKCMHFAVRIVNLCHFLTEEKHEFNISNQVFRSGTSIGANIAEAQCAISKKDFINKVYIALKKITRQFIGLNYCIRHIISSRSNTILSILMLMNYVVCSFPLRRQHARTKKTTAQ